MIEVMITAILAVLGLILGSFVNAFVWRLHEQEVLLEGKKKPSKKQLEALSITKGRSMCPNCKHELAAKDLVPLFSWLALGGKCRYCHKPISWQYPLVELLTALAFGLSYALWPLAVQGSGLVALVCWLGFVVFFMALAVYDLRWYTLPNKIVYPLIVVALAEAVALAIMQHKLSVLLLALAGAAIIAGFFAALFYASSGNWIGGGDVKLAIVLGLLAGTPLKAGLVIFAASVLGTIVSVPLAIKAGGNLKLKIPFGPFLLLATAITVLAGDAIIHWYTHQLI